ncbi:GMC family oxidoreductase N-terminal domain-containing protein [Oricola sp.]|uniref:GMC family oxidoreductase n=1 Tax=Oricola sp. TaxID=1979950 RepID=UPI0025E74817|nr:GMC family oxidoreductase N-terminal domain-containing protein [Oricola sp.]MCI5076019.1 GMC family oxidoreductase N-terminal domain-containing protein [Oricola sp.]
MSEQTYDYIIAGGGTAGCLLANRLSEKPDTRVLMVEAGGSGRHPFIEIPLMLPKLLGNPRFDWMYKTAPEPHLGGRTITLPRGKVLGGSSAINGMVYVRGHRWDYDNWAAQGNDGWAWSDVLPYFMRSEGWVGEDLQGHGRNGEWKISDPGMRWPVLDGYLDAADEIGIKKTRDYNCGENEGAQYFQSLILKGRRQSTEKAFLRPAADRPNLTVVTGAMAERVVTDGRRATGLVFRQNGQSVTATATREVILSSGAYGTPALMERSGIGQADRIKGLGLEVVHDLPGVGENLQDHWHIRITHRVQNTTTLNGRAGSFFGKALMAAEYGLFRTGPMSAQPPLLAVFARVMEDAPAPDVQIHTSAASYDRVGGPMHDYPGITSSVCILRPESLGHCHATSTEPAEQPEIVHNFLATDYDCEIAARSVELVRKITAAPAMAKYAPQETSPGPAKTSREELIDYARQTVATTFHPVGTAKMGQGADAVVDAKLKVHGMDGLRVVDASIMPTIPSGNTCAPVVMIAERAADLIRAAA